MKTKSLFIAFISLLIFFSCRKEENHKEEINNTKENLDFYKVVKELGHFSEVNQFLFTLLNESLSDDFFNKFGNIIFRRHTYYNNSHYPVKDFSFVYNKQINGINKPFGCTVIDFIKGGGYSGTYLAFFLHNDNILSTSYVKLEKDLKGIDFKIIDSPKKLNEIEILQIKLTYPKKVITKEFLIYEIAPEFIDVSIYNNKN